MHICMGSINSIFRRIKYLLRLKVLKRQESHRPCIDLEARLADAVTSTSWKLKLAERKWALKALRHPHHFYCAVSLGLSFRPDIFRAFLKSLQKTNAYHNYHSLYQSWNSCSDIRDAFPIPWEKSAFRAIINWEDS